MPNDTLHSILRRKLKYHEWMFCRHRLHLDRFQTLFVTYLCNFSRRLIERLEGLRHSRLGNGETDCILCGEVFRFYHHSQKRCAECGKMTCGKCGKECCLAPGPGQSNNRNRKASLSSSSSLSSSMTSLFTSALMGNPSNPGAEGNDNAFVWLCKICAEQRDIWKKSGAWFFKVGLRPKKLQYLTFIILFGIHKCVFLHWVIIILVYLCVFLWVYQKKQD